MTMKNVRIPEDLYKAAEEAGQKMHMPASVAIRYYLQKGIDNGHQLGNMSAEKLLEGMENAANEGTAALNDYLVNLTVHEEQAVKYKIKPMRQAAALVDEQKQLAMMPDIKAELDKICLQGVEALEQYHAKLPKTIQRELKPVWHEWRRDAGFSDHWYKQKGTRPTERRAPELWERDSRHSEAEEVRRWDEEAAEQTNGQVMDTPKPADSKAGKRLCPHTLKYI